MSWIVESPLTYFQRFCVNVIKCGPIPRHVAIIMDGNRHYATKTNLQKKEGHIKGFDKMAECLQWCLKLGIAELTVYALSIENFKRSKAEVDALIKLATEKFQKLLEESDKIMADGICIRVIGNMSLLSAELRKLIAKGVFMTKDNNRIILNIAFAYTSRDEIVNTVKTIVEGVEKGLIHADDISENLISECLFTSASPDPDILIRTSGEIRFSDFLLWQISNSYICFADVLWPESCIWNLLACILKYQRCYNELQKYNSNKKEENDERTVKFLEKLQSEWMMQLENYIA